MAVPPEVIEIVKLSLLNPATLVAGYWLGRKADQPQKVAIAGFAAAFAGLVFAWLLMKLGIAEPRPRLLAGVFVLSALVGCVWAAVGYWSQQRRENGKR